MFAMGRLGKLGAVARAVQGAFAPFSPASLFAPADQGYWYDNQDLLNYMGELGPDSVVNGDFSDGLTGWSNAFGNASVVTGRAKISSPTYGYSTTLRQTQPFDGEGWYRVRADIENVSMQQFCILQARYVSGDAHIADSRNLAPGGTASKVDFSFYANAPFLLNFLVDLNATTGRECFIDNIRCEKVLSISNCTMFQDTVGTVPVTAVEQPVGRQLDKSGKGNHRIAPGPTTSSPILRARYNLYLNSETFATQSVSVVAGQYRLRFEGTGTITLSGAATGTLSAGTHTVTCTTGTLTSTVSGVVTRADLRTQGIPTSLPPYQRITTATDYDTVGFPLYLDTDGADDWMRTASTVDFSGSDKVTLVQGLHKRVDTPSAIFNELSTNANTGSAFCVVAGLNASYGRHSSIGTGNIFSGGSNLAHFAQALYPAPDTAIISATHDIAGDLSRIWRNGVVGIDGTVDKGAGNFRNDHVYFYSRAGTGIRFNGRDYGQFAISRLLSDEDRAKVQNVFNVAMGGSY